MSEKNYRAIVVRSDGEDQDWGFYELRIDAGTLAFRCNEDTPVGNFDHYLAPGTWLEVQDVMREE